MWGSCLWIPLHVFWYYTKNISNIFNHIEYYFSWRGSVHGHPEVFVYLTPYDGDFHNISIFHVNVRKNTRENVGINMQNIQVVNVTEYGSLFTIDMFNNCAHWVPRAIMNDWRNVIQGCIKHWHYRSLFTNWLWQVRHTYQDGGGNGESTRGNKTCLLQRLHLYR